MKLKYLTKTSTQTCLMLFTHLTGPATLKNNTNKSLKILSVIIKTEMTHGKHARRPK